MLQRVQSKLIKNVRKVNLHQLVIGLLQKQGVDFTNDEDFQAIIAILRKEKQFRNAAESDLIFKAFKPIKFFSELLNEMGEQEISSLFKELQYETLPARSTVFNIGDIGRKFYIVLRGSVWVLVKIQSLDSQDQQQDASTKKQPKKKQSIGFKHVRSNLRSSTKNSQDMNVIYKNKIEEEEIVKTFEHLSDEQYLELRFQGLKQVGVINFGNSFGEIALTKQIPRTATIICREDTHFVTLSREKFNKFLSEYYEKIQQKNIKFLKSISVFKTWTDQMLNQLYYHFTQVDFIINQVIYSEGNPTDKIYLIHDGEVEISKRLQIQHSHVTQDERVLENFTHATQKNYMKQKRIRVSILGRGQMFGHEEVMAGYDVRSEKAVCSSHRVRLFALDKQRFLNYCAKGDTLDKLQNFSQTKHNWHHGNEQTVLQLEVPKLLKVRHTKSVADAQQLTPKPKLDIGHINGVANNFMRHYEDMKNLLGDTEGLTIDAPYFEMQTTRARDSSMYRKWRLGKTQSHLIKTLRLPKVLDTARTDVFPQLTTRSLQEF